MAQVDHMPTWSFVARNLHEIICRLCSTGFVDAAILQLEQHKKQFIDLLDNYPKNTEHRKLLQEGKVYIDGILNKVNDEFSKEVIILSDELDINENVAATIYYHILEGSSNTTADRIYASIEKYHNERGYLLETLKIIIKSINDESVNENIRRCFSEFIQDIMDDSSIPLGSDTNTTGTFPAKILQTAKKLNSMVKNLEKDGTLNKPKNPSQSSTSTTNEPSINSATAPSLSSTVPTTTATTNTATNPLTTTATSSLSKPLTTGFGNPTTNTNNLFGNTTPQNPLPSGSTTSTPTIKLDEEITKRRIKLLKEERVYLMEILYHLASLFWLKENDLLSIIDSTTKVNLLNAITPYLTMILMTAISPQPNQLKYGNDLTQDSAFIQKCHAKFQPQQQWKVPALKSMITLQWVSFLTNAIHHHPGLEMKLSIKESQRKEMNKNAVHASKVFGFINDYLLYFKQQSKNKMNGELEINKSYVTDDSAMMLDGLAVDPGDYTKFSTDIKLDFQPYVVKEIEQFTTFIIKHMIDLLKDINYEEEDLIGGNGTLPKPRTAFVTSEEDVLKKNDLELFFSLLASIYHGRPNDGLWFWTNEEDENADPSDFIKWIADMKLVGTVRACYEFLGAISCGDRCAIYSYNFLEAGSVRSDIKNSRLFSWGKLFAAIQFYEPLLNQATDNNHPAIFPPGEENLLINFLYVLNQVVQYSVDARLNLWNDSDYHVSDSLTKLANSSISASLRSSLCNTLAAFCSPWGGGIKNVGRNISLQIWNIVENGNVFIIKKGKMMNDTKQGTSTAVTTPSSTISSSNEITGFMQELSLERESKKYVETLSLLNLLENLIHTQTKRDQLQNGFSMAVSSIPLNLGKETRFPGAQPYITSIIDDVFLSLDDQRYNNQNDKWELILACLKVLDNCVTSFDLLPLYDVYEIYRQSPVQYKSDMEHALSYFITHPGFDIIIRILSGSALTNELFKIIHCGKKTILDTSESISPSIIKSMVRCLRILLRVMQVQNTTANFLIPQINSHAIYLPSGKYRLGDLSFSPFPSTATVGDHMLYNRSVIVDVAQLINCNSHEEICYLSNKIIHGLSMEPKQNVEIQDITRSHIHSIYSGIGSKLTEVLEIDKASSDIIYRYKERLEIEKPESTDYNDYEYDINNIPFWLAADILNNSYRNQDDFEKQHMATSVRLAILDTLIDNLNADKPSPTITEYLLGINSLTSSSSASSAVPSTSSSPSSSPVSFANRAFLHLLLSILQVNLDNSASTFENEIYSSDNNKDSSFLPLTATHPVLAEKCYQLIFKLCARKTTSFKIMQYLRVRDDFFYKQLKLMMATPLMFHQVSNCNVTTGSVTFDNGRKFDCDMITLRSELHRRVWLLKTVAIELHVLSKTNSRLDAMRMLNLLYPSNDNSKNNIDNDNEYISRSVTIIKFPETLGFVWKDDLANIEPPSTNYFKHFDKKKFQTKSITDCTVNDIKTIYSYLRNEQQNMKETGDLLTDADNWAAEIEMGYILKTLVAENHTFEINYAKTKCLEAWCQLIRVNLLDNIELLSKKERADIHQKILEQLFPNMYNITNIENKTDLNHELLNSFAKLLLTIMTQLHQDNENEKNQRKQILEKYESERNEDENTDQYYYRQQQLVFSTTITSELVLNVSCQDLEITFKTMMDFIKNPSLQASTKKIIYAAIIHFIQLLPTLDKSNSNNTDNQQQLLRQQMLEQVSILRNSKNSTFLE
ncbi:unnamed protein product [Cunninghamella blakesleeana]